MQLESDSGNRLTTYSEQYWYPSTIIQNNISPETLYEGTPKLDLRPYDVTNRTDKFRVAQKFARDNDLALCSNGVLFHKHDKGIIPELLEKYGSKRNEIKCTLKDRRRLVEYAKTKLR
jgi:DNA polymerase elongation subunit (family B)